MIEIWLSLSLISTFSNQQKYPFLKQVLSNNRIFYRSTLQCSALSPHLRPCLAYSTRTYDYGDIFLRRSASLKDAHDLFKQTPSKTRVTDERSTRAFFFVFLRMQYFLISN